MTRKSYIIRYSVFIVTVIITIIVNDGILRYNLGLQDSDAEIINLAGRQRMLSQRIVKDILLLSDEEVIAKSKYIKDSVTILLNEFEDANTVLLKHERKENDNAKIQNLLVSIQPLAKKLIEYAKGIINSSKTELAKNNIRLISNVETSFLPKMENLVREYQSVAEKKLAKTKNTALLLSLLSVAILLGEFIFIILPFFNDLILRNKALDKTNQKLSDFAQITSHNLRAPLSNLNSLIRFYKESDDAADKNDLMNKFEMVVNNMNDTMNVLVTALKVSAGPVEEKETISFEEVLTKTKESISTQITESNAKITADFTEADMLTYNKIYLESIFLNLLTNAIRYKSEHRDPEISIKTVRKKNRIILSFRDNGLGINMKRHGDKLFGLNKTFHRHPDSKGVGLFMTRSQIEGMGGDIYAESTVDKGTTFFITF